MRRTEDLSNTYFLRRKGGVVRYVAGPTFRLDGRRRMAVLDFFLEMRSDNVLATEVWEDRIPTWGRRITPEEAADLAADLTCRVTALAETDRERRRLVSRALARLTPEEREALGL